MVSQLVAAQQHRYLETVIEVGASNSMSQGREPASKAQAQLMQLGYIPFRAVRGQLTIAYSAMMLLGAQLARLVTLVAVFVLPSVFLALGVPLLLQLLFYTTQYLQLAICVLTYSM